MCSHGYELKPSLPVAPGQPEEALKMFCSVLSLSDFLYSAVFCTAKRLESITEHRHRGLGALKPREFIDFIHKNNSNILNITYIFTVGTKKLETGIMSGLFFY